MFAKRITIYDLGSPFVVGRAVFWTGSSTISTPVGMLNVCRATLDLPHILHTEPHEQPSFYSFSLITFPPLSPNGTRSSAHPEQTALLLPPPPTAGPSSNSIPPSTYRFDRAYPGDRTHSHNPISLHIGAARHKTLFPAISRAGNCNFIAQGKADAGFRPP